MEKVAAILSEDGGHVAWATLVSYDLGIGEHKVAPSIILSNITPQSQAYTVAGRGLCVYLPEEERTFVGCKATAAFGETLRLLAVDVLDNNGNSVFLE